MTINNPDIREAVNRANLKLWEIANELKLSDSSFSRKLRKPLSNCEKLEILRII